MPTTRNGEGEGATKKIKNQVSTQRKSVAAQRKCAAHDA
jgi:hypothetical protein